LTNYGPFKLSRDSAVCQRNHRRFLNKINKFTAVKQLISNALLFDVRKIKVECFLTIS